MINENGIYIFEKDSQGWERMVFGEIIIPGIPDVFGTIYTVASVKQFAYTFMSNSFNWDIDHDNLKIDNQVALVESFLVRPNDPDFPIVGSWVVGTHIKDDDIWRDILDGKLSGYSYEAWVRSLSGELPTEDNLVYYGETGQSLVDGHSHKYYVVTDIDGRVKFGGTDVSDDHFHDIFTHSITEKAMNHSHLYRIIEGQIYG